MTFVVAGGVDLCAVAPVPGCQLPHVARGRLRPLLGQSFLLFQPNYRSALLHL